MPYSPFNKRPDNPTKTSSTLRPTIKSADTAVASTRHSKLELSTDDQWLPPPAIAKQYSIDCQVRKQTKFSQSRFRVRWNNFTRRLVHGTAPSTSSVPDGSTVDGSHRMWEPPPGQPDDEVDEVVVDRVWFEERGPSTETESVTPIEKYGDNPTGGTNTDRESLAVVEGFWAKSTLLIILRWRIWPALLGFFLLRFIDEKSEAHYRKEAWFFRKRLALFSSLFFVGNWVLGTAFLPRPAVLPDKIFYYGIAPAFTVPLVFMVIYDFPRDRPWCYQIYLAFSIWSWSLFQIVSMHICGFYAKDIPHRLFPCGSKDFLSTFYYTSALQTLGLFGLNFNRFPAICGVITFFVTSCVLLLPAQPGYARNAINFLAFQAFLLYAHYLREHIERRVYTLRDQLKIQFKATQKAQVNEKKTADSKRRLTSYVRVPLNTALLAVQNMSACGAVSKSHEVEFNALEGSLNMMSKVLNDVLDFHRMDSGRFESFNKPYVFHQVMESLFTPLRLDTDSRELKFETYLDRSIDEVAGRAFLAAMEQSGGGIHKSLIDCDGVVVGDENRLKQIITNLAGNACKFTPAGGTIKISTKLLCPDPTKVARMTGEASKERPASRLSTGANELSEDHLSEHNYNTEPPKLLERIIVRIEVTDTGYGIQQKEMYQTKLFNAFTQTEAGRQQGGKGTGLGLALVRQIVKLSGGRLGVSSKVGQGSTFWVELPLGVGKCALSILPEEQRLSLNRLDSDQTIPLPSPPTPDIEAQLKGQSGTVLEQTTSSDGLVQLMPRKRKVGDAVEHNGGCKGSGLFTPNVAIPPVVREDEDESPRPGMSSEPPPAPTPDPIPIPVPSPETLTKPLQEQESQLETLRSPSKTPSPSATRLPQIDITPGLQVLVVDDDKMTRMLFQRMLGRLKCSVTVAVNGYEALQLITGDQDVAQTPAEEENEHIFTDGDDHVNIVEREKEKEKEDKESKFGIVFLDNQMPVMSGVEMVRKLRKLGRKDLVVGVTGNALLPDQEEYLEAGVDHILTKPVREENVRKMLVIADERRKARLLGSSTPLPTPTAPPPDMT
ncbi:hypothetical protein BDM02DRAFT_3093963 [Thelephora ganbajun]|uniref:Uncharacterized protein n=1 Tax=Thelephora ganbajun TaxID=370292 RepID=A0ACB6ZK94_THEGA|nr:hypothetical protein BDM02DRAFT_3093963 [Thelephora ganbajun]